MPIDFCKSCGIFLVGDKEHRTALCSFCFTRQPKFTDERRSVKIELEMWLIELRSKRRAIKRYK
ncbi:MAG TPA: hypothetical protein VGC76_02195 [Pyrinomonadaceae bacterium]|jgi:hypothetical protein